jgi:hypothetical protein
MHESSQIPANRPRGICKYYYCAVPKVKNRVELFWKKTIFEIAGEVGLAAMPEGQNLSETVMHVARLDPEALEHLMMAVVEDTERAQRLLEELG